MAVYYMRADGTAVNKGAATGPVTDASKCMSVSVHNGESFSSGDTIWMSPLGGIFRNMQARTSGVIYQSVAGSLAKISGAQLLTGWASDTAPIYSIARTSNPYFVGASELGVWEDDAPLYNAGSLAAMTPGSYFYDTGVKLYIWTYESDDPSGHIIEAVSSANALTGAFFIQNKDLTLNKLWLEKGYNGAIHVSGTVGSITVNVNDCVLIDSASGCRATDAGTKVINLSGCTAIRHAYAALYSTVNSNTTINATNCILAGTLGVQHSNYCGATCIHNLTNCIEIGSPRGIWWVKDVTQQGGTINRVGSVYKNPRFISGGSNGLGRITMGLDDYLVAGEAIVLTDAMTSVNGKMTWCITSVFNADAQMWADVNTILAAGHKIGCHTRNHPQMATAANGVDVPYAFYINCAKAGTVITASYDNTTHTLKTTIDAVDDLVIDIDDDTSPGGYDVRYLGASDGSTGLIGYISHQAGYAAGYPAVPNLPNGLGTYEYSSHVLADQIDVDINSINGNLSLDSDRLFDTEVFTSGLTGGVLIDYALQAEPIKSLIPNAFSFPRNFWSQAAVARLYAKGIKYGITMDYNNNASVVIRMFQNFMYPLAAPIYYQASAEKMSMQTAAEGIDEAENHAAFLSIWPGTINLYTDGLLTLKEDYLIAYMNLIKTHKITIKDLAQVVIDNETEGAVWDATNHRLTRKIVPEYNLQVIAGSPAYHAGSSIAAGSTDILGNPRNASTPTIGAYEGFGVGGLRPDLSLGGGGRMIPPRRRRR